MNGEQPTTLHSNGDGSYKSSVKGAEMDHPSIGHAMAHIAGQHEPDSDHMMMCSDGMGGLTSYGVRGGGEVESNEHESGAEAGSHAGNYMDGGGMNHSEPDEDDIRVPMSAGLGNKL